MAMTNDQKEQAARLWIRRSKWGQRKSGGALVVAACDTDAIVAAVTALDDALDGAPAALSGASVAAALANTLPAAFAGVTDAGQKALLLRCVAEVRWPEA